MERALTRLETVRARQTDDAAVQGGSEAGNLAERHDKLKAAAAEALAGIDALLADRG
ncbi:MAG: hypothetical protein ACK4R0_06775 [Blastomonas sp.]